MRVCVYVYACVNVYVCVCACFQWELMKKPTAKWFIWCQMVPVLSTLPPIKQHNIQNKNQTPHHRYSVRYAFLFCKKNWTHCRKPIKDCWLCRLCHFVNSGKMVRSERKLVGRKKHAEKQGKQQNLFHENIFSPKCKPSKRLAVWRVAETDWWSAFVAPFRHYLFVQWIAVCTGKCFDRLQAAGLFAFRCLWHA